MNDTFESSPPTLKSIRDAVNSNDAQLARYKTLGGGGYNILTTLNNAILHRLLFTKHKIYEYSNN